MPGSKKTKSKPLNLQPQGAMSAEEDLDPDQYSDDDRANNKFNLTNEKWTRIINVNEYHPG